MIHQLPQLPYNPELLAPVISSKTIEFHFGKHHQAYVNNLNNLITGTAFENATLEEIVKNATGGIFNNGAQVWNHTFYWNCIKPGGSSIPNDKLYDVINKQYGSLDKLKEQFAVAAASLFGSGWAWLVKKNDGSLDIIQESNAGNPLRNGFVPLFTCDVWEHAYYLDYQNRRPDYIKAFWDIVDWETISKRY